MLIYVYVESMTSLKQVANTVFRIYTHADVPVVLCSSAELVSSRDSQPDVLSFEMSNS